jgi:hypothetical protein
MYRLRLKRELLLLGISEGPYVNSQLQERFGPEEL